MESFETDVTHYEFVVSLVDEHIHCVQLNRSKYTPTVSQGRLNGGKW